LNKSFFGEDVYQNTYDYLNDNELFISKARRFLIKKKNEHVKNIDSFLITMTVHNLWI